MRVGLGMKIWWSLLVALTVVIAANARRAEAVVACNNNSGYAPRAGMALPPHPRIVYFTDNADPDSPVPVYFAKIGGKAVPVKVTTVTSTPYTFHIIEVDSEKTGKLAIGEVMGKQKIVDVKYVIKADATLPTTVPAVTKKFHQAITHSSMREKFDGMAIAVDDATPALLAHVKLRRDAQSDWFELDAPVIPGDWMDSHTVVKLGELGCTKNFTVDLLKKGVDIQATVMLVDGSTLAIDMPAHASL